MDIQPEVFTADYTGQPGERTFFIQAKGDVVQSYLVEKQQVVVLAEKLREMMLMIDQGDDLLAAPPARDPGLALTAPIEPEWRVGPIGLGYAQESDSILLSMGPASEEEAPPEEEEEFDDSRFEVRYMLRRDQVRAFVLHAMAIVGEGRPLCQLCGLPMDPSGHNCPASNGHRAVV
jgi:uncharacterized repeat protein (TIGR03847 family)